MKFVKYSFVLVLLAIFFISCVKPENNKSSAEYLAWKNQHEADLENNKIHQNAILSSDFKFNHLELVEVSAGKKYFSLWGHLMLRFSGSGKTPDDDLVLSFLADFNDFPVSNLKASTGGYVVMPKIGTVLQYKNEYEKGEGRSITFHPILVENQKNLKLLNVLRQWIIHPEEAGGYSFFYNNCVSLMTKLLIHSEILPNQGLYGYWPKYVPRLLGLEGIINYEQK
jgi:hypothetical protein